MTLREVGEMRASTVTRRSMWRPIRAYWSSVTLIGRSSMRQPGIGRLEVLAHDVGQELHAGHRGLAVEPVDQELGRAIHRLEAARIEAGLHDALFHLRRVDELRLL